MSAQPSRFKARRPAHRYPACGNAVEEDPSYAAPYAPADTSTCLLIHAHRYPLNPPDGCSRSNQHYSQQHAIPNAPGRRQCYPALILLDPTVVAGCMPIVPIESDTRI
jgi:hypothetical protein